MNKKNKWYVVWKGKTTGIFTTWDECAPLVKEFPGAQYKSFESRAEAESAFQKGYSYSLGVSRKDAPTQTPVASKASAAHTTPPISDSFVVDAACSGNPGPVEYRGIHLLTGSEFFHQGPFPDGSNNIGEFLAIVHALALLSEKGVTSPIYSDSRNAIGWVQLKKCKTTLTRNHANAELFRRIDQAEKWLAENHYRNPLLKWETTQWGENPADFGRK